MLVNQFIHDAPWKIWTGLSDDECMCTGCNCGIYEKKEARDQKKPDSERVNTFLPIPR
jgi:hypothetical protein